MNTIPKFSRLALALLICLSFNACSKSASVTSEVPSGAKVAEPNKTKDPSLPIYLLQVQPFYIPNLNLNVQCRQYGGPEALMNAAFVNALVASGNLVVLDSNASTPFPSSQIGQEERGPYIVRASLTEFNRNIVVKEKGIGAKPHQDDNLIETLGKAIMLVTSFWITQITGLPTSWSDKESRGVVGIDVSVLDTKNNQIIISFPARGEFVVKNREIGDGIFGYYSAELVSSPVESAVRATMNEAATKLQAELAKVAR